MSNPHEYDPLPLTSDDLPTHSLYNAPPSPDHRTSSFHTPTSNLSELVPDVLPSVTSPSRFLGPALYEDVPRNRDSFASSNNTLPSAVGAPDYTSSVYALHNPERVPLDTVYRDDPRDFTGGPGAVPMSPVGHSRLLEEKRTVYAPPRAKSRRRILILGVLAALILLIAAVVIPVYFLIIKPKTNGSQQRDSLGPSSTKSGQGALPTKTAIVTGGDGSTITMEDGTTFTYVNKFGGYWYYDENDPLNNGARAQSWAPALNETFNYGIDKIRGVNIGGWLNTEPFMQVHDF
ncbi:hypothetical protein AX15_003991 [Amanita polypyramis BW_CC]|nr:hypothetical protein AX15_003991 [Amanita polypyramis BW_CC]